MILDYRAILRSAVIETTAPIKKMKNKLTFFYGHHLGNSPVDPNYLYDNLKKLNKKVTFISFDEACSIVSSNKNVKSSIACFSFDDGFREVSESIVPVLKSFDVNSCIFVNPAFIEANPVELESFYKDKFHIVKEPSSWEELRTFVKNGGIIGSHTNNHLRLSESNNETAAYEIIESKKHIESKLDINCKYFAWPYGTGKDISKEQIELALDHYELIFSAIRTPSTFYFNKRVINRDHFEGNWKYSHLKYFLSLPKDLTVLNRNLKINE